MLSRATMRAVLLAERDPELAWSTPSRALFESVVEARTSIEIVQRACEVYADRPALGARVRGTRRFETITYRALWERIARVASGLHAAGARAGTMTILIGSSTIDHVVAELACHYLGAVSVPLARDVAAAELVAVAVQTRCSVVMCSAAELARVTDVLAACPTVTTLVVLDADNGAAASLTLDNLAATPSIIAPAIPTEDPLLSLVYTSGSTGTPKGAMFCERSWRARWRTLPTLAIAALPMISVVFLPQNHMGGRNAVANSLKVGGLAYFTSEPDMSTLFEDIRLVRPTYLHLVPRLSELIYQHYEREVARTGDPDRVVAEMRAGFLGDRMLLALTASAPTPPHVLELIRATFEIPVIDVFAGTEYGHLLTDGTINTQNVLAYKLESVPELGYAVDDAPHPRGELLVKTARGITSYFQNAEATARLRDPDGFLRTGDIFEQRGPDELVWLDRRNNVLKLAQGEFVNLWKLEAAFAASPLIHQVFLHGDSTRAHLVGIVVPAADVADAHARVTAEIQRIAGERGLAAYEIPRALAIEPVPFSRENGLLTSLGKPARPKLLARYRSTLDALYARPTPAIDHDLPVAARVEAAVTALLGRPIELARTFKAHGGDSLAASELCAVIEAACGARLSPSFVLAPDTTLGEILAATATETRPRFTRIHGAGTTIHADDLRLDRFFDAAPVPPATAGATLLTGATGFLGRFLCLELMARGPVIALVRAKSDAAAMERLARVYGPGTPLHARFLALANRNLRVIAGDLERPSLGLSARDHDALAEETGSVVHAGALVNHVLPYAALFDANVGGTAEVLRFALARRRKRFVYISTNAVAHALLGDRDRARETDDTRALGDGAPLAADRHAYGYQLSKWAGEVLVRDLAERHGGDVAVLRCNLILPPAMTRDQVAPDDFLTRLVASVIATGVYPRSFYAGDGTPHLDGLPVDFLAATIADLAAEGRDTYHLSNIHWEDGISLDTVMQRLVACGYPLACIDDHAAWFSTFERGLAPRSRPIVARWRRPLAIAPRRALDATRFRAEVRARRPLGLADVPGLDIAYLDRCIADMQRLGLIPVPA